MPPPESDILTAYLLLPAPLPSITTLDQFRALFPRSLQTNPQVPRLYRDLQAQRNGVVDAVAQNIGEEARRGVAMRREVLRARLEGEGEAGDLEIEIERALYGDKTGIKSIKHTLQSILPDLEGAVGALEDEIQQLHDDEEQLLASIAQTVDSLGNLRYGSFSDPRVNDLAREGLVTLQEECDKKSKS
ncbi:hypothetical protein E4U09_007676 [Claviceps aff. purpurea]|uniref:Cnl2/NKP2 family protein n=1 Tax=Claviceps aff. purpurea TaxID=1967640 RepID=A0A9P7QK83_9HYPO|nr:hypothetical protein E4U50_002103 [Claviceps purpurea]KAG6299899.1 hypothetical protein E4U09_007676 [Claviceps aff. purpurea]